MASATGSGPPLRSFLPPDPRVEEPYLLTPQMALRVAILGGIALVVFFVLFLRLWSLQILSSEKHRQAALDNQLRQSRIEAPRGPILDRNGRVLVRNVASTAIVLWPASLPKRAGRHTELTRLSSLLDIPFPKLRKMIRAQRSDPLTPVTLRVAAHPAKIAYLYEHESEFPGVQIKQTYLRYYNSEALLAQALGFVGEISKEQLKQMRKDGYRAGDRIGQSGIEAAYDEYLRGAAGIALQRVDSLGRVSPRSLKEDARPGDAVRLTVDIGLQRAAERALQYGINLARENHEWAADGGAIVALDPNTGDVLAMASAPTFRPSVYSGLIDRRELRPLLDAKTAREANYPGLNRATAAIYPPGSTFKPVTALAALQEHLVSPYSSLPCTGTYTVPNPYGGPSQVFRNWDTGVNTLMQMPEAIAASCDTYFYRLGHAFYNLPPERGHPFQAWASRFGLGASTGIDIGPEERGILPTPEWREATYTKKTDPCCWRIDRTWKPGDSIQLSIGQKDIAVTPLQMARFYAMIANGGKLVVPHVVADVEEPGGSNAAPAVLKSFQPPPPEESGLDPAALQVVRDSLYLATHASYGTATAVFGNFPIPVAGKTGTAEKIVQLPGYSTGLLLDQSWWCGYAPADRPTIALCAVIENGGHGGSAAAPAALKVFEHFFGTKASAVDENPHSD